MMSTTTATGTDPSHARLQHRDPDTKYSLSSTSQHTLSGTSPASVRPLHKRSLPSHESSNYPYLDAAERVAYPLTQRPPSPDTASRASASSSAVTGAPPLRKRPKTISIKNGRAPNSPGVQRASSVLSQQQQQQQPPDDQATREHAQQSIVSSKTTSHAHLSNLQQSPSSKRPPASHSSYGVETTCGPPPSYSTQRTLSQERIKKVDRNTLLRMQTAQESNPASNTHDSANLTNAISTTTQKQDSLASLVQSSPNSIDTQSIPTPTEDVNMANVRIRNGSDPGEDIIVDDGKGSSSDERKSEDLFLNIAKVDAARLPIPRPDKRRSRISLPFISSSRMIHGIRSPPAQQSFENPPVLSPPLDVPRHSSHRSSLGTQVAGATSRTNLADSGRRRERSLELTSDAESPEGRLGQRLANLSTNTHGLSQRSSQGFRGARLVSEAVYVPKSRLEEHVATESTISTTAPSTVWDELDDLKSRIRKLELTGKLPPSSAAAMSSAERPRTATTVATTMSTSPKYKASGTPLQSTMEDIPQNFHPLLHEALGNARQLLSNDVYQKLHATAQDALKLAAMVSTEPYGIIPQHSASNNDKQIKRRTESMCRGLTELAIALTAESKPLGTNTAVTTTRDVHPPPNTMLRSRRYSNDQGDRSVPSRVHSRLDTRRASIQLGRSINGSVSPETRLRESPTAMSQASNLRLNRTSTLLRHRQSPGYLDGADDHHDSSPSIRPVSRARTDIGAYRRTSRDHTSTVRTYTSQHPMPGRAEAHVSSTPLPASVSTNFTSRRRYASPGSVSGIQDSSSFTPPTGLQPAEPWGQISIVPGEDTPAEAMSEVNANHSNRSSSTRRSMGFASRIGSTVGSRLRAVRADRAGRESNDARGFEDVVLSRRSDEETSVMDTKG